MVLLNFSRRFEELNLKIEYFFVVEKNVKLAPESFLEQILKFGLGVFSEWKIILKS